MPLAFAFKITAGWAGKESLLQYELDKEISRVTGSPYCHVEAWIGGPIQSAQCFSSRQPHGTSIQTIDLRSDGVNLWRIVQIPTTPLEDAEILGFCKGSSGRKYDEFGIIGIALDTTIHDPYDRICSESCFEVASLIRSFWSEVERWMVAPGCPTPTKFKRYGLFELLAGLP